MKFKDVCRKVLLVAVVVLLLGVGSRGAVGEAGETSGLKKSAGSFVLKFSELEELLEEGSGYKLIGLSRDKLAHELSGLSENLSDLREQSSDLKEKLSAYPSRADLETRLEAVFSAIALLDPNDPEYLGLEMEKSMLIQQLAGYDLNLDSLKRSLASLQDSEEQLERAYTQMSRALSRLDEQKKDQLQLLKLQAENLYIALLNLGEQQALMSENQDFLYRLLAVEKVRHKEGLVTQSSVEQVAMQAERGQLMLKNLESQREGLMNNLKLQTGLDLEKEVQLKDIKEVEIFKPDLEKAVDRAITAGADVLAQKKDYDWKLSDRDYYQDRKGTSSTEYKKAVVELEEALIKLEDSKKMARINVEEAFRALKLATTAYQLEERSLELAQKIFEEAEARYNAGLISGLQLAQQQLEVMKARQQFYQTRLDYVQALKAFRLAEKGIVSAAAAASFGDNVF